MTKMYEARHPLWVFCREVTVAILSGAGLCRASGNADSARRVRLDRQLRNQSPRATGRARACHRLRGFIPECSFAKPPQKHAYRPLKPCWCPRRRVEAESVNKYRDETQPYCNSGQRKAIDDAHTSVVSLMVIGELCLCVDAECVCMMSPIHSISRRYADDKTRTFLSETDILTLPLKRD
jgi:hypothetical protein